MLGRIIEYLRSWPAFASRFVLRSWDGIEPKPTYSKTLILYAHYDPDGRIDPYVFYALEALKSLPADIVFVSTSDGLGTEDLEKARKICTRILLCRNQSLDFGSWKTAMAFLGPQTIESYDQLMLTNDSVYGPFGPLKPLIEKMKRANNGFWGLTSSAQIAPHLQSYFLMFDRAALGSSAFRVFWKKFRFHRDKGKIIHKGELGLSTAMSNETGIKQGAVIGFEELRDWGMAHAVEFEYSSALAKGEPMNPTLHYWKPLIEHFDFPYLKTEIIKKNRLGSKYVDQWQEIVKSRFPDYPLSLISNHIARIKSKVRV